MEVFEETKGKKDFEVYKCQNLPEFYDAAVRAPPGGGQGGYGRGGYGN
jgi:hypothetical protein